MDTAEVESRLKGTDEYIEAQLKEWKVPGLGLAVVVGDESVLLKGYGLRDVEKALPVTPDTLFAIGSCTKAFTGTVLGTLVDEGKLEWDRPVREYLPWFRLQDPYATERMTARDLTSHRSGLPRHDMLWYSSSLSRRELIERMQYVEPSKDFRTTFQYQNMMFVTAGYLGGHLAGATWEELVDKRIFQPLGMNTSSFAPATALRYADCSYPYELSGEEVRQVAHRDLPAAGPAGSIYSSVREMANWLRLNLNKGKFGDKQIISEAQLREVHSPQMPAPQVPELSFPELGPAFYGFGWVMQDYRHHACIWHNGGIDGYSAYNALLPNDHIAVVALTNMGGSNMHNALAYHIFDRLLGLDPVDWSARFRQMAEKMKEMMKQAEAKARAERVADTKPTHALDAYVGEYRHPGYGSIWIEKSGEALKARYNGPTFRLEHFHYDTFTLTMERLDQTLPVLFHVEANGKVGSLSAHLEPMVKPIVFTRLK